MYNQPKKTTLLGGESNPGLLCDRQGYSPLYYQGTAHQIMTLTASDANTKQRPIFLRYAFLYIALDSYGPQ